MRTRNMLVLTGSLLLMALCGGAAQAQVTVAAGAKNIFTATVARNATLEPMLQVSLRSNATTNIEVTQVTVSAASNGTGNDATDLAPGGVHLFWDKNADGRVTTSGASPDVDLGSAGFNADGGMATLSGFVVPMKPGSQVNLLVTYTLGAGATAGESFRARIAANTDIYVRDAVTTTTRIGVSGAPVEGYLRTVGKGTLTMVRLAQTPDGGVAIPNRMLLPMINLELRADDVEDLLVSSINFQDVGTANVLTGVANQSVRLFQQPAPPTSAAAAVAQGDFPSDNGLITLTPAAPLVVPRNSYTRVWVTFDIGSEISETLGNKYQIQSPGSQPLQASGAMSHDVPTLIGASSPNGPEWVFGYNPITLALNSDLGAVLMPRTATNYPMLSFQVKNGAYEPASISRFDFHADGTMNEAACLRNAVLFQDKSPYGRIGPEDTTITTTLLTQDNGTASFTFTPIKIGLNTTLNFIVGYNLNGQAVDGQTARVALNTRNDVSIVGDISMSNCAPSPLPFAGQYKTVGQPRAQFTLETNTAKIPDIVAPGATGFPLLGFSIKNGNDEKLNLKGLRLKLQGPGNELNYFKSFELWTDVNLNGEQDKTSGDVLIGSAVAPAADGNGDGLINLDLPTGAVQIDLGVEKKFTLYADVDPRVAGDGTETFTIVAGSDDDIIATGVNSNAQADFTTTAPPIGEARVIRNPALDVDNYKGTGPVIGCINGGYGLVGSAFNVPSGEDLLIQRVRFQVSGTLDWVRYISGAFCWTDPNRDFLVNQGETNNPFGYHGNTVIMNPDGTGVLEFPTTGTLKRCLGYSLSYGVDFAATVPAEAQAQLGKAITMALAGNGIIEGIGARSRRPIEVTNKKPDDDVGLTISFGHGTLTVSQDTVTRTAAPPGGQKIETMAINLKTHLLESVEIDRLTLSPQGTLDESKFIAPGGIKLYMDNNRNGVLDDSEKAAGPLATADPPSYDNGPVTFTAGNFQPYGNVVYTQTSPPYDQFLVTVDLTADAPEGKTVQFAVHAPGDIAATGHLSLVPYVVGTDLTYAPDLPPLVGPEITLQRGALQVTTDSSFANDADNKPAVTMVPGAMDYEVARFTLKANPAENVIVQGLSFRSTGSGNEAQDIAPQGVKLYKSSIASANLLTSGTFNSDDGTVTLRLRNPLTIDSKTAQVIIMTFTGSGTGQKGSTFNLALGPEGLNALGASSSLPITTMLPASPYLPLPIRIGPGRLYLRATGTNTTILPIPLGSYAKIQPLYLEASRTEAVRLDQIQVRASGSADESRAIQNGALLLTNNGVLAASAPFQPGDNGLATLKNLGVQLNANSITSLYSLDVDLNAANTVVSTTLQMDLETTASVLASGLSSGQAAEIDFSDMAGGDYLAHVATISGRQVTLSSGIVTLSLGTKGADRSIVGNEKKLALLPLGVNVANNLEGVTISDVWLAALGTANEPVTVDKVYLYDDVDQNGQVSANDVLLAQSGFSADNGTAHFQVNLTYAQNTTKRWLVAGDLTGVCTKGQTLQFAMPQLGAVAGIGQLTKRALNLVTPKTGLAGTVYTLAPPEPPVAANDQYVTPVNRALAVTAAAGVLANDTDADTPHAQLTALKTGNPAHGSLALSADGSFTYTPAGNYLGSDSFSYKASDGLGQSNTATVSITVAAPPVAAADSYSVVRNRALSIPITGGVLSNDTDADTAHGMLKAVLVNTTAHGTLTLMADGSFRYIPAYDYVGSDSFTYKANDGLLDSAPVTVTIAVTMPPTGTVEVKVTPATVPWTLTDSFSDVKPGVGSQVLSNVTAGTVTLTWLPVQNYDLPAANPVIKSLAAGGKVTFQDAYIRQVGQVSVSVTPATASWTLLDGDGVGHAGKGNATLDQIPTGQVKLLWGALDGYNPPSGGTETQQLNKGGLVTFTGVYPRQMGSVLVRTLPGQVAWTVTDSNQKAWPGSGTRLLQRIPAGPVKIAWGTLAGYDAPTSPTQTRSLDGEGTLEFLQILVPTQAGPDRTQARLLRYLVGLSSDASGLDLNADGKVNVQDLVKNTGLLAPSAPASPNPVNGATQVPTTANLGWAACAHATSYDVYLWKAAASRPGAPTAKGLTGTLYDPPAALAAGTQYRWQVVARSPGASTTGPQWSFTTRP